MNVSSDLIPLAARGRSQLHWRWDVDFSSSQSAKRLFGYEAAFVDAMGIGGPGWFNHDLRGVRCPSRLRERRDCSQSLFFKFSWTSGMLPGLTTLNLKVKFSERLSEDLQKLFLQQRFLLGGGRSVSGTAGDVDGGAGSAVQRRLSQRNGHRLEKDLQKCMNVSEV